MTPKQILDSFSETLMRDGRILSVAERELLSAIVQHAKATSATSPEMQESVRAVIASAVGEVVAQRAFTVLGASIVEHIVENNASPVADLMGQQAREVLKDPQSPGGKDPQPPGVKKPLADPQSPGTPKPSSPKDPQPPGQTPLRPVRTPFVPASSPDPQSPGQTTRTVVSQALTTVVERPEHLPARSVVLDEFLSPQELAELTSFTLAHEAEFETSEVVSPTGEGGVVNYDHRRSRVLMDLGAHQDRIVERIKTVLPDVLQQLGMEDFAIADVEAQITASNDGDYFHFHSDNASERAASRYLTFVYFFHREPRQFKGGDLRIHDAHLEEGAYVGDGSHQTIVPQQNQIVFFPCELMHEITAVECSSEGFADSRFTVNGWLRR